MRTDPYVEEMFLCQTSIGDESLVFCSVTSFVTPTVPKAVPTNRKDIGNVTETN